MQYFTNNIYCTTAKILCVSRNRDTLKKCKMARYILRRFSIKIEEKTHL